MTIFCFNFMLINCLDFTHVVAMVDSVHDISGPGGTWDSTHQPSRSESQEKCIIFNNKPFLYGHVTLSLLDLFIVTKMF